jgi:DNA-binding GntR family transcriptional regulator
MEQATHKGKVGRLIFGDMQFHQAICELSGHQRLLEIWLTLKDQLGSFIAVEENTYGGPDQLLKTHYPLMEAIKKGDSSLAERRIREHLFDALQVVKGALRKNPEGKPS